LSPTGRAASIRRKKHSLPFCNSRGFFYQELQTRRGVNTDFSKFNAAKKGVTKKLSGYYWIIDEPVNIEDTKIDELRRRISNSCE
jgi:hypothetical protein